MRFIVIDICDSQNWEKQLIKYVKKKNKKILKKFRIWNDEQDWYNPWSIWMAA